MSSTILIVEDDDDLRKTYADYFEMYGYTVLVSQNGEDALIILDEIDPIINDEKQPVIVILDVSLPGIDGINVCQNIRKKFLEKIYIIMISAIRIESEDRVEGLEIGADVYRLKQNLKIRELRYQIMRHENSLNSNYPVWDYEDTYLRFRISNPKVEADGNAVELTRKEFDLLKYLFENKDGVCLRDDIYKEVWREEYGGYDDGAINTCVSRLRNQIDSPKSNKSSYVKTIPGFGYQFESQERLNRDNI